MKLIVDRLRVLAAIALIGLAVVLVPTKGKP